MLLRPKTSLLMHKGIELLIPRRSDVSLTDLIVIFDGNIVKLYLAKLASV